MCEPHSTSEQDAMKGRWVRVPRNLNMEASIFSGWLVCSFGHLCGYFIDFFRISIIVGPEDKMLTSSRTLV